MFYDIFVSLCKKKGITQTQACNELGYSRDVVTRWKTRGSSPRAGKLPAMAEYFGVSVPYLLGEEEKEKPLVNGDEELTEYLEAVRDDPDLRMLFSLTKGATKKDIQDAIAIIQMLRSRDKGDLL